MSLGMSSLPAAWNAFGETVGALLESRAAERSDAVFIRLLDDHGREQPLSHAELLDGARRMAASLQARGVRPGERVMVGLPTGRAFLELFFGTLLAGATAVPFYPPARAKGLEDYQESLAGMIRRAAPTVVVTSARARLAVEAAAYQAGARAAVVTPEALDGRADDYRHVEVGPETLALIQFTSGSTSAPKGVMLTHRAILANIAATRAGVQTRPDDVVVSWLPLYHDMGLIGMMILPLFCGIPLVLMSPQSFLLDAKRWLWTIHTYRATISTAPNFAYQLVVNRLKDAELAGLDLSGWRLAYNGAEPVLPATMSAFGARLAPYGFSPDAFKAIYGMAELAVAAAFPDPHQPPRLDWVDGAALEAEGRADAVDPLAEGLRPIGFPSVGPPLPGYAARLVSAEGQVLPERRVGEIELSGPSLMAGYLNDPESTAAALAGGWLRTGDLGYMADGELFIVGRVKDMILKGGRNYAPQDVEHLAEKVEGVRKGCVAAFGVPDAHAGTEAVVVLAETREHQEGYPALAKAIALKVSEGLGLLPDRVVMVPPGHLPKTSSGKLQRGKARQRWLDGELAAAAAPGWLSMTRIVGQAIVHRVTSALPEGGSHGE